MSDQETIQTPDTTRPKCKYCNHYKVLVPGAGYKCPLTDCKANDPTGYTWDYKPFYRDWEDE